MCGRFTLTIDAEGMKQNFPGITPPKGEMAPRHNVAPTQPVLAVANNAKQQAEFFVWGLIPSWAKDPSIGNKMINARGETLAEKPSFRSAYKRRRCLILADGFYEWRKEPDGKTKTPMYIRVIDEDGAPQPFAFAGLWEIWHSPYGDEIPSCTIITTEPNEFMAQIHNRMPVILPRDRYDEWLDPAERPAEKLQHLLTQYPADRMHAYAVSTLVNNSRVDSPDLVLPV
jgi:putative SOS response-associated peptidase YedK